MTAHDLDGGMRLDVDGVPGEEPIHGCARRHDRAGAMCIDADTLLPYAVRYALGRRTYAVGEVCSVVLSHARDPALLGGGTLGTIARDIRKARDAGRLGDPCDERQWLDVLAAIERAQR